MYEVLSCSGILDVINICIIICSQHTVWFEAESAEAKVEAAEAAVWAEPLPAAAVVDSILVDTVMAKLVDFSKWMPMVTIQFILLCRLFA